MPPLVDESLPPQPFPLFARWKKAAEAHEAIRYAGAMTLSTVTADGFPDGRIVLLHAVEVGHGFAFFTDVRSAKGQALARAPRAALTFYWGPLERQVRVQGRVAPASAAVADRFFEERPRRSRPTAWASPQSRPLPQNGNALEQRMATVTERFAERGTIPRPPHWQAFWVVPRRVEFWEARARRLHARVCYEQSTEEDARKEEGWRIRRLAP